MRRPNQVSGLDPVPEHPKRKRRWWRSADSQSNQETVTEAGDSESVRADEHGAAADQATDLPEAYRSTDSDALSGEAQDDSDLSISQARAATKRAKKMRKTYRRRQRFNPSGGGGLYKLAAISVAIGIVVVLGVSLLTYTQLFAVKNINVHGGSKHLRSQVESSLSGLRNTPIAKVTTKDAQKLLTGHAQLESFSLAVTPPATLDVTLVQRTEIGYQQSGDKYKIFDPAGVVTRTVSRQPSNLPEFEQGPESTQKFEAAATVVLALPKSVRKLMAKVDAKSLYAVTLTLTDGRSVAWGDASQSAYKAKVLQVLLKRVPDKNIYDVSAPSAPIVK